MHALDRQMQYRGARQRRSKGRWAILTPNLFLI
jgi:hypothetical protein